MRFRCALLGLDHLGQLLAQLWAIVMTVHRHGVLHRRVYKFFLSVGRNRNRTFHLAWIVTAIHNHSSHWQPMSLMGHSLPIHSARMPTFVRC